MEQEILSRLQAQEQLLQKVYISVEKTRKYFVWTFYMTLAFFILPLLALMFILPSLISTITSGYGGLL